MFVRATAALALALGLAGAGSARAACTVKAMLQLPVTLQGGHPIAPVALNGQTLGFVVDSGASMSTIDEARAKDLKLRLEMAPINLFVNGVGGLAAPQVTTVERVTIGGFPLRNIPFLVQPQSGMNVLGQNLLGLADAEYDFPHAAIRVMKPEGCGGGANLAYWARPQQGVSVVPLDPPQRDRVDRTVGPASLNGKAISVAFDTGAQSSVLTLAAAARAGIKPDSPGVVPAGAIYGGGDHQIRLWMATFASFKLGDEEVKNVRIKFGDLQLEGADMLLGDDFFLSHRVYVANSQRKIYVTYEGGPVFDLSQKPTVQGPDGRAPPAQAAFDGAEPTDAAGYARRASVYVSRNDFDRAIADLDRAMVLAPNDPGYVFKRAAAHLANHQPASAMADLDQTLKLTPNNPAALAVRGRLRLDQHDKAGGLADFDAAAALVQPADDLHLTLGEDYRAAGRQDLAILQYDQWISAHAEDGRVAEALFGRCRARAVLGRELDKALADCNRAAGLAPKMAGVLEARAMVRLKSGDFARAIADYDAALLALPTDATALYGRGLAELKLGKTDAAQADMAAAARLAPRVADQAKGFGLSPG